MRRNLRKYFTAKINWYIIRYPACMFGDAPDIENFHVIVEVDMKLQYNVS